MLEVGPFMASFALCQKYFGQKESVSDNTVSGLVALIPAGLHTLCGLWFESHCVLKNVVHVFVLSNEIRKKTMATDAVIAHVFVLINFAMSQMWQRKKAKGPERR